MSALPESPSPLDDAAVYERQDSAGMFGHIHSVGPELLRAWEATAALDLPASAHRATSIVVCGIGGSATAGDYFAAIAAPEAPLPVAVIQGYDLPAWVGPSTLVVACSYSGNTPETLSAYAAAVERGAPVVAITSGGQLTERAGKDGVTICPVSYQGSPRAATVHALAPLLRIGQLLGITAIGDADVVAAAAAHREVVAQELDVAIPAAANRAKQIAGDLVGRFGIILGAGHLDAAAVRFKNQLAENGKAIAAADFIPQVGHNLVVGLTTAARRPDDYVVVALSSYLLSRQVAIRHMAVCGEFVDAGIRLHGVLVSGGSALGDILKATAWGDYVSCYLALLNGEDPTPIPQIERVRAYGS